MDESGVLVRAYCHISRGSRLICPCRTTSEGEDVRDFEEACSNLLKELLRLAGLLESPAGTLDLALVDVGFGCGDQTCELIRLTQPSTLRYVGLTMNQFQVDTASRNVSMFLSKTSHLTMESFKLFCANAAVPRAWGAPVKQAVQSVAEGTERWLLALDCLYHFSPSRRPLFRYNAEELKAGMMAFDLLLNPEASLWNTWKLRAIGVMMGCPVYTFLTEEEYRKQLLDCGYQSVVIQDITKHVFPGVTRFLDDQERALSDYGVSLGGYKLAGRLFNWFGKSGVVKAVLVVARTKEAEVG